MDECKPLPTICSDSRPNVLSKNAMPQVVMYRFSSPGPRCRAGQIVLATSYYADRLGGSNGDGAWRVLVTIVELIDPRPYIYQVTVYGNLICSVIYMSDRLLT